MWPRLPHWSFTRRSNEALQQHLEKLRHRTPLPLFWLFGKTQSGKTSIIKFLTGADDAEVGQGFKPCTRFSREFIFPDAEAPLLAFLDTRGVDEPGYDPTEDLARFNDRAHVVIVTVKALDHAQENVLRHLHTIRQASRQRPVVLALTCLHEAYPQQQHPQPYPFHGHWNVQAPPDGSTNGDIAAAQAAESPETASPCPEALPGCPQDLARSLSEHCRRFQGLFDGAVPIDLTRTEDGFDEPNYGGDVLKQTILDLLPRAYRQALLHLEDVSEELEDLYARRALPHIIGYSTLAGTAGAVPIPWLDLLVLPGIQTRMIYHLAKLYGRPLDGTRFLELASTLGLGVVFRQAVREVIKFIPYVGSVAGGVLAAASTFALGKAFCYYLSAVHQGHVPSADDLKRYYSKQLSLARQSWKRGGLAAAPSPTPPRAD